MNVFVYFQQKLASSSTDTTLHTLPTDSPCGKDCVAAIDAAAAFIAHIEAAVGPGRETSKVVRLADMVCQVYWRG